MAAEKVVVTKSKLDNLAEIISSKSEEPIPLTIDEMGAAVLDLNLVNNQNNKTIKPTAEQQIITADTGYTGLGQVTVDPINNVPLVANPDGWYKQVYNSSKVDGYFPVTVNPAPIYSGDISLKPNTTSTDYYSGWVYGILKDANNNTERTRFTTGTTTVQVYDFIPEGIELSIYYATSNAPEAFSQADLDWIDGKAVYTKNSRFTLEITPSTDYDPSYATVVVKDGTEYVDLHMSGYFLGCYHVYVPGEPNLLPGNIKKGVSIYDVNGTYSETFTSQELSITPSNATQVFDSSNVDGYKPVIVDPAYLIEKTVTPSQNKQEIAIANDNNVVVSLDSLYSNVDTYTFDTSYNFYANTYYRISGTAYIKENISSEALQYDILEQDVSYDIVSNYYKNKNLVVTKNGEITTEIEVSLHDSSSSIFNGSPLQISIKKGTNYKYCGFTFSVEKLPYVFLGHIYDSDESTDTDNKEKYSCDLSSIAVGDSIYMNYNIGYHDSSYGNDKVNNETISYNGSAITYTPSSNSTFTSIVIDPSIQNSNIIISFKYGYSIDCYIALYKKIQPYTPIGLSKVVVDPIPSEYIIPVLQSKTVTPTESQQTVSPDSGYDGLDEVTVNAIPSQYIIPSGTVSVTQNGTVDVTSYANANVNVELPTSGEQIITPTKNTQIITGDNAIVASLPSKTLNRPQASTRLCTYSQIGAYLSNVVVGESYSVDAYINDTYNNHKIYISGTFVYDFGSSSDATSYITNIGTVTQDADFYDFYASNPVELIKWRNGEIDFGLVFNGSAPSSIFMGTGSYIRFIKDTDLLSQVTVEPIPDEYVIPTLQSKTVTPTESQQVVAPDTGYDGMDEVTVNAIPVIVSTDCNINIGSKEFYTENNIRKYRERPSITSTKTGYLSFSSSQEYVGDYEVRQAIPSGLTVTPKKYSTYIGGSGYILEGAVEVTAIPSEYIIPTGELEITTNGTSDVTNYASVDVNVQSTLQSKTITPTEAQQTVSPDSGYDALSSVTVGAISSTYVGSGIEQRDETDLTASGATVTVPAGYYAEQETKTVASGSATAPATIMGGSGATVGRNSSGVISLVKTVSITPTVTPGYISTGTAGDSQIILSTQGTVVQETTYTPTTSDQTIFNSGIHYFEGAQKVTGDSDLIAENIKKDVDIFGVTGTYEGTVINNQDKSFTPDETGSIITPDEGYTGLGSVTVNAISSSYVGSGIDRRSSSDLTGDYGATATGKYTVTAPSGYYESDATYSLTSKGASNITTSTSGGNLTVTWEQGFYGGGGKTIATVKDSDDLSVSGATVTVPAGYYATAASTSVASGSASTPATSMTANPTISVSSSGLITASVSASQNVTPTVSAGYVSSGTAGAISVSGSKTQQLTTKAAATITPGTTNQTIAAGTYLTGTQTIAGDADLVASNIKAGVQIFGVTGNLSFITYYTGSSDPSSSLGSDGDIYLKVA